MSLVPVTVYPDFPLFPSLLPYLAPPDFIPQWDTSPFSLVAVKRTHHLVSEHDHPIGNGLPDDIQHHRKPRRDAGIRQGLGPEYRRVSTESRRNKNPTRIYHESNPGTQDGTTPRSPYPRDYSPRRSICNPGHRGPGG